MRIVNYAENTIDKEFTMTVKLDDHEWRNFDVRTFDVINFHDKMKTSVNPKLIQNIIYGYYNLSDSIIDRMADANDMGRIKRLVDIRRYCYYFIRTYTTLSFEEIGALYDQDHSTVMHHFKKVKQWLDVDSTVVREVEEIRNLIIDRVNPVHDENDAVL